MFVDLLQEHIDHEMSAYPNEFAAAFDSSRRNATIRNDSAKINELTAAGKYVVVESFEVSCPHTDAIIGGHTILVSAHDTEEEAMKVCEDQPQYRSVYEPVVANANVTDDTFDDCPF